jgi:hypothetical protein
MTTHLQPTTQTIIDRRYKALRSGSLLLSYLVLLHAGFALPSTSLSRRCALTLIPLKRDAPFHPYPEKSGRYIFCGTFHAGSVRPDCSEIPFRPSLLTSTLPYGVRTFLPSAPACPSRAIDGPRQVLERSGDRPACPRYFYVNLPVGDGQSTGAKNRIPWTTSIAWEPGGARDAQRVVGGLLLGDSP